MHLINRKRLARLMAIQDVSARQLAKAAGWASHSYMNRLLSGDANTLDPEPAARIARYLKVETSDLFVSRVSTGAGRRTTQRGAS